MFTANLWNTYINFKRFIYFENNIGKGVKTSATILSHKMKRGNSDYLSSEIVIKYQLENKAAVTTTWYDGAIKGLEAGCCIDILVYPNGSFTTYHRSTPKQNLQTNIVLFVFIIAFFLFAN